MDVNESNAIKLMKALVAGGCGTDEAIPFAHLQRIAVGVGLDGADQVNAVDFAHNKGWLADGPRDATMTITPEGWDNGNA